MISLIPIRMKTEEGLSGGLWLSQKFSEVISALGGYVFPSKYVNIAGSQRYPESIDQIVLLEILSFGIMQLDTSTFHVVTRA